MTTDVQAPQATREGTRETFDSLSPLTGDVVGTHPVHTAEEVEATVARAREAAAWWSALSYDERAERLTMGRA